MTRNEAKRRLEVWLKCGDCPEDKQCYDSHLHSTCEYTDYCDETPISEAIKVAIKALEQKPKTISIPEGATNGDVVQIMFNKTFPKTIILYKNDESRLMINPMFSREWWERPYKESEEI